MPSPSAISKLSEAERAMIEKEIIARNFADYDGLVAWLKTMGFELSRSAIYRHGDKLRRKLEAVRNSTEAARMIAEYAPDEADQRSAAVISLVQSEMFDLMVSLQELTDANAEDRVGMLKDIGKTVLDMTRASHLQKKLEQDIRKSEREEAAKIVDKAAKAQGVSEAGRAAIRDALGIA